MRFGRVPPGKHQVHVRHWTLEEDTSPKPCPTTRSLHHKSLWWQLYVPHSQYIEHVTCHWLWRLPLQWARLCPRVTLKRVGAEGCGSTLTLKSRVTLMTLSDWFHKQAVQCWTWIMWLNMAKQWIVHLGAKVSNSPITNSDITNSDRTILFLC